MVQILDQHLDNLVCSECQKYLSVLPVKVYENGSIKCGRCCTDNDGGVVSLYQELAKLCLFKCNNRYEGCRKLLLPSEVETHEQTCTGQNYRCPTCETSPLMLSCQLKQHFENSHRNNLLSSCIFYLTLSRDISKENFFYIQDDNIFIILVQLVPNDKCLYISTATLCKLDNVIQQFVLSLDPSFKHTTKKQKCVALNTFNYEHYYKIDVSSIFAQPVKFEIILDMSETSILTYDVLTTPTKKIKQTMTTKQIQTVPVAHIQTVELSAKFCKQYPLYNLTACGTALYSSTQKKRIELTCSNCKEMMASNVYTCLKKKHLVCWDCKAWCGLCECPINGWNSEMASVSESLMFPCKWKCGVKFASGDLRNHELYCDMNKRGCPICGVTINVKYLKTHLPVTHGWEFAEEFCLTSFLKSHSRSKDFHCFMIKNKMFKIKWRVYNSQYNLQIVPCDGMDGLELLVVIGKESHRLENWEMAVMLEHNPKFYLKFFH